MDFLECASYIPRPETGQEATEQAIQEIKRMVGLPLDDPKSAATTRASKQSADKALHTTNFTGRRTKRSVKAIKLGRITKSSSSKAKTSSRRLRRENKKAFS